MIILGIDPGYAIVGWGLIQKEKSTITFLRCGAITTTAKETLEHRLAAIYQQMDTLLKEHTPDHVAIEQLYFSTNVKTALDVAQARGVLLLAVQHHHIPLFSYGPLTVKQTITGDGNADKTQMQLMVKRILKLSAVPKPDDVSDAVAIALTHGYMNNVNV